MSARLGRTADGWWLVTPAGLIPLGLTAPTTAALLAGRAALDAAIEADAAGGGCRSAARRSQPGPWTCSAR